MGNAESGFGFYWGLALDIVTYTVVAAIVLVIVVKLIRAIAKRNFRNGAAEALDPVVRSASKQSEFLGWKPVESLTVVEPAKEIGDSK